MSWPWATLSVLVSNIKEIIIKFYILTTVLAFGLEGVEGGLDEFRGQSWDIGTKLV